MSQESTESRNIPVPFTNMAVSLSGGGYRATTFHLGALSYLDFRKYKDRPLLENVSIVSTISGGTLTGVMYALKLAQGETFADCFHKLYKLLSENNLVDLALEKLNKPAKWKNKYKSRDLINAFSEVYDELFLMKLHSQRCATANKLICRMRYSEPLNLPLACSSDCKKMKAAVASVTVI